jgi:hypothetical protein
LRRALAAIAGACLIALAAAGASGQVNPPVPAPTGPVNPALPAGVAPGPAPEAPDQVQPAESPAANESAAPESVASPAPLPTATPPPIVVDPATLSVEPGKVVTARVNSAAGTIAATTANLTIATVYVDQADRTISVVGQGVGTTTVTVSDGRGLTRDVPVRVAYAAGAIVPAVVLRVTGDPASAGFLRSAAIEAAESAAMRRPGARFDVAPDAVTVRSPLATDDRTVLEVPLQISGDAYLGVTGTTRVEVENFALPRVAPRRLLVSDYPERLTADGVLFSATIDRSSAQRFLYYHFNPSTEPARRILVKLTNSATTPATVHIISALAGPGANEMEVGHNATRMFLIRARRNEGTVVTVPAGATVNIINHDLPPNAVVNGILQLREVSGDPLDIAVVAQNASAPFDQSADAANPLAGGPPHARGVYPVPEFFSEYTYPTNSPALEIPIGQLPLPNLREGEALSGDYGVMQSLQVVIVNNSRFGQAVALYANPRGGAATGTFIIDDTLVQAHRLPAFSRYKIWQETIAPGTYRTLRISTMPEGGSSYPLRLVFAQDDGSVAPGAPGSPVY